MTDCGSTFSSLSWDSILVVIGVCALAGGAFIEIPKRWAKAVWKRRGVDKPWWAPVVTQTLVVVFGTLCGLAMSAAYDDLSPVLGMLLGASSGTFTTLFVRAIRDLLKTRGVPVGGETIRGDEM